MPFVHINEIELYYEVHGTGPAIVFCHGSGGNHLSWWQQVPYFSRAYCCITFDHRAFGRSSDLPERAGRTMFAPDLIGLLDYLGIEQVFLVAQSMGGRTAAGLLLRQPERVRAMVFSGTTAGCVDDEVRALQAQFREANAGRSDGVARGLSPRFSAMRPDLTFLYRSIARLNPRRPADFLAPRPGYRGSTAPRFAELKVPTLFIVGEDDVITPPPVIEAAARLVPHARFVMIPRAGHAVYYEQPDLFNRTVRDFFSSIA